MTVLRDAANALFSGHLGYAAAVALAPAKRRVEPNVDQVEAFLQGAGPTAEADHVGIVVRA